MTDLQKKCYDILLEFDRVCRKADLKYYIYAGTLLGAVRHHGFIPWDDDIDVVMFRKDWDNLPLACGRYLNADQFELQTIYSDPMTDNPWMKLHDRNTAFISSSRREGAMEGVNIDIFPIDNAPDRQGELKRRARFVDRMNFIYQYRFCHCKSPSFKMRMFQKAIRLIPPLNETAFKEKYNQNMQKYNQKQTKNVVYCSNRPYMRKVVDRSVFSETVMLPFEGKLFPAPGGWERVLTIMFGDYMTLPPEEEQVTRHGAAVIDLEHSWREYKWRPWGYEKI